MKKIKTDNTSISLPLIHPICYLPPSRLDLSSAWIEHIPFGMFVVDLLRPKILVELGTHSGVSYCAFCQAVKHLGLDTRCYAVDTWAGDEQSGHYGESVLMDLRLHHDPLYKGFSTLMQNTFDEAVNYFSDGSIDLLHIDGYHTYEATKHDFETWLPKLSEKGVVLIHDTNVRERDFGVWKLWSELTQKYQSFELFHGHGLGLLCVGSKSFDLMRDLLSVPEEQLQMLREFFYALGSKYSLQLQREQDIKFLQQQIDLKDQSASGIIAEKNNQIQSLSEKLSETNLQSLTTKIAEIEMANRSLLDQTERKGREIQTLRRWLQFYGNKVQFLQPALTKTEQERNELARKLDEVFHTTAWKLIQILWKIRMFLVPYHSTREKIRINIFNFFLNPFRKRHDLALPQPYVEAPITIDPLYQRWIQVNEPNPEELDNQIFHSLQITNPFLVSIITPVFQTPIEILCKTINSVLDQTYPHWELILSNGSPESDEIQKVLDDFALKDPRIKIKHLEKNLGIVGNTNAALEVAGGELVVFLDHDDVLAPFAIYEVIKVANENQNVDLIYSDEDKLTDDGNTRFDPYFKPAFSIDLLRSMNYMPHLLAIRRNLGTKIGWLRVGFDGAQDYDLILRAMEKSREIAHIPKILYHWRTIPGSTAKERTAKNYASESGIKALKDHLQRLAIPGSVELGAAPTIYRITYNHPAKPAISIIIPNKDHADDLKRCVNSILEKTTYKKYEILIIENHSQEEETFSLYRELLKQKNIKMIENDKPFNFSIVNNDAVEFTNGEYLLFLNNDIEVINPDWLDRMLNYALRPDVGIVGAKLYYPNDTNQHSGVIVGLGGVADHIHKFSPRDFPGYFYRLMVPQDISAVTGACLLIRKTIFNQVEGFDPGYQLAFGDIDLCLKVRQKGYLVVWTPYAELYHYESKTRGYEDTAEKVERFNREMFYFQSKWDEFLKNGDEYYNPNLSLDNNDFRINSCRVNSVVRIKPGLVYS